MPAKPAQPRAISKKSPAPALNLSGSLWLQQGHHLLGGADSIALLEAIEATGAMTHAAKLVGISYKTAWDRVHDMNNAAGHPLVERQAGGAGGGGTVLTPYAQELIQAFRHIEATHARILSQLSQSLTRPQEVLQTLSTLGLRTSARNQLVGTVAKVIRDEVEALVELSLPCHHDEGPADTLFVSLTTGSINALKIVKGMQAVALIKAPSIRLSRPPLAVDPIERNSLMGRVTAIHAGARRPAKAAVNEVQVRLKGGQTMVATVSADELRRQALLEGSEVLVQIDEQAIILGVV